MKLNSSMQEYIEQLSKQELFMCVLKGIVIDFVFSYFFYKSWIAVIVLMPIIFVYAKNSCHELVEKKRWDLTLQFKELLGFVNSSMQAGYSIENAFRESVAELIELYGRESPIVREVSIICKGLDNNIPITNLVRLFGKRVKLDEISSFADILAVGKYSGGNLVSIMNSYINIIDDKVAVLQEIETMISSKKYEQQIMNMIPFVILLYVDMTSPGFFAMLYHNLAGILIMTIVMAIYITSVYMSKKIIMISV